MMETDRYIGKPEIAEIFSSSWEAAAEQLAKAGVSPINLGPGRKRGKRWLHSAVMAAVLRIHKKAQPKPEEPKTKINKKTIGLADMKTDDIQKLVSRPAFTSPRTIQ